MNVSGVHGGRRPVSDLDEAVRGVFRHRSGSAWSGIGQAATSCARCAGQRRRRRTQPGGL